MANEERERARRRHALTLTALGATIFTTGALGQEPPRAQLTVTIKASPEAGAKARRATIVTIHGTEKSFGRFAVNARVHRVPCRGDYEFDALAAQIGSGATGTFVADVTLGQPRISDKRISCGDRLPKGLDRGSVSIAGTDRTNVDRAMSLSGRRIADGSFAGTLTLTSVLCEGPYRFVARFVGRRRKLTVSYPVELRDPKLDGRPLRPCDETQR